MTQLLQNAAYGTAMILAVMALRWVLKERLVPEARLALWAVCLFRLLTPVPLESMWSLWGLLVPAKPAAPAPAPVVTPGPGMGYVPALSASQAAPEPGFPWEMVLGAAWLAVGLALTARYAVSWLRTRRSVGCTIPVDRGDPRYSLLPKFARLREGVMDGAPLTFGAARPTVVLSPGLGGEELVCVLAHEGVHAERRDNLWHYVMALALAVHWWNPAVWLMSRLLRRDIELACDKAAVKKLGADRRADYARVLVDMATQGDGPAFCQSFGRKATEERIRSIMKFKKTTMVGVILTLTLVVGVSVAFASSPKEADKSGDGEPAVSEAVKASAPEGAVDVRADGAPGGLNGFAVRMDGSVVTRVIVSLDILQEDLDIRVKEGSMSKAEAELIFSRAQAIAQDGVIDWTFAQDAGLRHEELPEESAGDTTVSANGYWDKDGKFVPVSISEIVDRFILPQAVMGEDLPSTEYNPDDFQTVLPEMDEQGNSMIRDENGDIVIVGVRTASGTRSLCKEPSCEVTEAHYHDGDGEAVRVYYESPGLLCAHPDCGIEGPHEHDGTQYAGKAPERYTILNPELEPVPSAAPERELPEFAPDYDPSTEDSAGAGGEIICGLPTAPTMNCGVEGCTETRMHQHWGDQYKVLGLICPVEGCDIAVCHDHDGVTYYCNGAAHDGGVCDGSCRGWSLTAPAPSAAPVRANCYPSENGHHGTGGHHGNGHQ